MPRFSHYGWWSAALVTMILLAVVSRPHWTKSSPSSRSIDDWNLAELAEQLNRRGVELRLRSTQENGVLGQTAFLTTIDKRWLDLNTLNKDPKRINEWRGVLYCERGGESSTHALHLWGDRCLVVGPFAFYGDAELLHRVGDALAPFAPPGSP